MGISINTSDYIKIKTATIDGVQFTVSPLNTAQSLKMARLQEELSKGGETTTNAVEQLLNLIFDCFDKKDEAKRILGDLPLDAIADIYKKIMEAE